jgi:hypothetical protein
VLRVCAAAEAASIPAVGIVSTGFLKQAATIARALGIRDVSIAEYPGTIAVDTLGVIREKSDDEVAPAVISALLGEASLTASGDVVFACEAPPDPHSPVFTGTLDEVQEHFEEQLWTDGLPIIPPTLPRVDRFLAEVDREPDEVLGVLAPEYREATVWSVAVNGVMAGCRPEHMPILVAMVEALADPRFRIQDAGSTPGWEPIAVVSGPMVRRLDFNSGSGLMRVGRRANTSIGRFLRLYMRNVAGLRIPPGTTDKASIGASFNVVLAEDNEAVEALGWPSLRVEQGFGPADDTVMIQGIFAASQPIYTSGERPEPHLEALAHILGNTSGPWVAAALQSEAVHPLLVLNPTVAGVLARHGIGKDEIRQYLFDHAKVEARWLEVWPHHYGAAWADLREQIKNDRVPPAYSESDDPSRLVPALIRPEWTSIVVAGDPGRNQSRLYINNHIQGRPVVRQVRFPERSRKDADVAPDR